MSSTAFLPLVQIGLGAALVGAAGFAWVLYFRWRAADGSQKPLAMRLVAVAGGYCSALLGLLLFRQLEQMGVQLEWERMGIRSSLLIGTVEESAKLFPVLLAVRLGKRLERPQDGLLLAACAGIGFSSVEAVVLWTQGDLSWMDLLARATAAPLSHALFSIPWGWGLAASLLWGRSYRLLSGLGLSIGSHGLYNWVLASPEVPQFAAALAVLALWLLMLRTLTQVGVGPLRQPILVRVRR